MDIGDTLQSKADQLNAVDLIEPMKITITKVTVRKGEQPVSIFFTTESGIEWQPWKPCLGMRKVIYGCWGKNSADYIGRNIVIFCNDAVTYGGCAVGGVELSHMSHIEKQMKIKLRKNRSTYYLFTVDPIIEIVLPAATAEELEEYEEKFLAVVEASELKSLAKELGERNFEKSSKAIIMEFYKDAKKRITDEKPQHFVEGE